MCTRMTLVALWSANVLWGKSFFIGETAKSTKFSFGKHFIVSQILVYDNIACDSSAVWQLNVCSITIAVECTPYRHKVACILLFFSIPHQKDQYTITQNSPWCLFLPECRAHTQRFWIGKSKCWDVDDLYKPGRIILHGNKVKEEEFIYNLTWAAVWLIDRYF